MAISKLFSRVKTNDDMQELIRNDNDVCFHLEQQLYKQNCDVILYGNLEIGEFILMVDADTRIPHDCLHDVLIEFIKEPKLGLTQHLTTPMRVTRTFWESFISHFTSLIFEYSIPLSCANGNFAPYVGHNAILRKSAMYKRFINHDVEVIDNDISVYCDKFNNCEYTFDKIWSENNVSEDFKHFLNLIKGDYFTRFIMYTGDKFKEGVSLCYDDEIMKFKKYTYGACEIMFNPIGTWMCCKGFCFSKTLIDYLRSKVDMSSKLNLIGYLFSYFSMASGFVIIYINYFMHGWFGEYMEGLVQPIDVITQIVLLFGGLGIITHLIVVAKMREKCSYIICVKDIFYIPFYFVFFGSMQYHLFKTILVFMFCKNQLSWGSTMKEMSSTDKSSALRHTLRLYLDCYIISFLNIIMMIILVTPLVPEDWQITNPQAIVPLALSTFAHILGPILLNPYITSRRVY